MSLAFEKLSSITMIRCLMEAYVKGYERQVPQGDKAEKGIIKIKLNNNSEMLHFIFN